MKAEKTKLTDDELLDHSKDGLVVCIRELESAFAESEVQYKKNLEEAWLKQNTHFMEEYEKQDKEYEKKLAESEAKIKALMAESDNLEDDLNRKLASSEEKVKELQEDIENVHSGAQIVIDENMKQFKERLAEKGQMIEKLENEIKRLKHE